MMAQLVNWKNPLRLTYERQQRGWSKTELARRARIGQATMSRIESGRQVPYAPELRRLAQALGIAKAEAASLLVHVVPTSADTGFCPSNGAVFLPREAVEAVRVLLADRIAAVTPARAQAYVILRAVPGLLPDVSETPDAD